MHGMNIGINTLPSDREEWERVSYKLVFSYRVIPLFSGKQSRQLGMVSRWLLNTTRTTCGQH